MKIDVVIVSYNTRGLLAACLRSVEAEARHVSGITAYVVDNASPDGSAAMVRDSFPWARQISLPENVGFGAANNRGIAAGSAPLVLLLNPDTELRPGALAALVEMMERDPSCAIAGPRLAYPDGSFQASCRRFPSAARNFWCFSGLQARFPGSAPGLNNWLSEREHETAEVVDMVSGACFLARRGWIESTGGFDENLFMYEEEFDLMYPLRGRSLRVRYCRGAEVVHHGGASTGASFHPFTERHGFRSKYIVFRKHYGAAAGWMTHASDRLLFTISALRHGPGSEAAQRLAACRRGWRESFVPLRSLREREDFFS